MNWLPVTSNIINIETGLSHQTLCFLLNFAQCRQHGKFGRLRSWLFGVKLRIGISLLR